MDIGLHLHLAAYLYILGCSQYSQILLGSLDLSQQFWVYYTDTIILCYTDIRMLISPGLGAFGLIYGLGSLRLRAFGFRSLGFRFRLRSLERA